MKTSYFAIAALGLAAIVLCNLRFGWNEPKPVPTYPVPSEPARATPVELPPLPEIPKAPLAEINLPAELPLVIPAATPMMPVSNEASVIPLVQTPSIPQPSPEPQVLQIPSIQLPLPSGTAEGTSAPGVLTAAQVPPSPGLPNVPTIPQATPGNPNIPNVPTPLAAPSPPVPVSSLKPPSAPDPLVSTEPASFTPHGKFVVLKGKEIEGPPSKKLIGEIMSCKLLAIEGVGSVDKKDIVVQQGSIVRNIPRVEVLFVGATKNDVYCFMRDRLPAKDDETARLAVARWCMFNGMREQALIEAKAILQFKPGSKVAADLARSLEESLKQFPSDGTASPTKPTNEKQVTAVETEIEVTPEAATSFSTRIEPILVNLCIDCHARADYKGPFKLTRISEFALVPQTSLANLRVTASQLNRSDPVNSPFLSKAITAHGGLKLPPFQSRQAPGYRALETWAVLAVDPSIAPANGNQTINPARPPNPPIGVSTPQNPSPSMPPTIPSGLPPVETTPALPAANPISTPSVPISTPSVSVPMVPSIPTAPPVVTVPPVLPTPPTMKPTVPTQPPLVPGAETAPATTLPIRPMVPPPPPIAIPGVPQTSNGLQPMTPAATGSQFGTESSPKPTPPGGPNGRDEFDPSSFNQAIPKK